jgi:hypothetical protein
MVPPLDLSFPKLASVLSAISARENGRQTFLQSSFHYIRAIGTRPALNSHGIAVMFLAIGKAVIFSS